MKNEIRIEFPSAGATYRHDEFGVYEYGTYGRDSVLEGQESRRFLDRFRTIEEARAAYPGADESVCGYRRVNLDFLPGDDDPAGAFAEQDYFDRVDGRRDE